MTHPDSLGIQFVLDDSREASPSDFRYLFNAIDEISRYVIVAQLRLFVETADISDRLRDQIYSDMLKTALALPSPAEISAIRRQSPWTVLIGISAPVLLWAVRKMIAPEIMQAWTESELREAFRRFVRDGLFQGAKRQVEASAAAKPQYGNLAIDDIRESPTGELRVQFKRTQVFEINVTDRQLMREFLEKIGVKVSGSDFR